MSVEQLEQPEGEWTLNGIAYCQVAIARDDLATVATAIRDGGRDLALDTLSAVIRQLEAARRHLA